MRPLSRSRKFISEVEVGRLGEGVSMGGGEDQFLEGSVLGASFWRWWNRAWAGGEVRVEDEAVHRVANAKADPVAEEARIADAKASVAPAQEFVYIAAVVPRPRPPRRPATSKPIDIPAKKAAPVPVFEVAKEKRYWYQ